MKSLCLRGNNITGRFLLLMSIDSPSYALLTLRCIDNTDPFCRSYRQSTYGKYQRLIPVSSINGHHPFLLSSSQLDVSTNSIGSVGAVAVASCLRALRQSLEHLDISSCRLTDQGRNLEGVVQIAESLEHNRCLQSLKMRRNELIQQTYDVRATPHHEQPFIVALMRSLEVRDVDSGSRSCADYQYRSHHSEIFL